MTVRAVEWKQPYTWGTAIEIDENKVISLRLRDENNLIIYDAGDNEIYVDLQLPDEITPTDAFPVWITTGRVIVDNGWDLQWTLICAKTTSGDNIKLLYADEWTLWIDNWTWTFKQILFKSDVDAIVTNLTSYINWELAKKQNWVTSATAPTDPEEWDLWYDTTNNVLKVYDWTQWNTTWWWGWGTWDVVWPSSATNGNLAVFDGTTWKLIKDGWSVPTWVPTVWTNGQVLTVVSWAAAWANPSWWDVLVSTQANNIFTSWMKIWGGTEADYLLLTPDSNTAYLLTANSPTPPTPSSRPTITGFSYDSKTLGVSQYTYWDVNWMAWKPDGTKFYITWEQNNTVYQFSCSTAWDVTTGTYDSKYVATGTNVSAALWFSDDGQTMWIWWGWNTGYVYKFTLSTAWDVSTASYVWDATWKSNESFYCCTGYCMADDWNYLYVLSREDNRIRRYTMSTPYDVTTLQTWVWDYQEYTPTSTYNHKVILNPDGTQLFYYARQDMQIHICALSTPFDLTTISETSQYTVTTPNSQNITCVAIDDDWNKMYIGGYGLNNIYQYSTTTA